ncbi:unnamed protein product [Hymenolepis diminuta]|uniref:Uncharacterized protein n=1 Tax=Hymenolepis diminuta TaxID=6216 RepID=A0A564YMJ2_HYMDI|nr:unnamed protein product [Hymenolepis diminuta]
MSIFRLHLFCFPKLMCTMPFDLFWFLLGLSTFSSILSLAEATVYNVTIPSKEISIRGVSAYLLTFGKVKENVEQASFAFDLLKTENFALLYTFKHFNLPKLSFNSHSECAALECLLSNNQEETISQIDASCNDNSNPNLYGPIVAVPGANRVTCKVYWYYPANKSALLDSLKLLFVGVYDGYCENVPSELTNFSKWCNVEVKNLVDEDYKAMERPLCMEEQVAKEVFNVTCSNSIKPNFPLSFTQFQVVSIVTGCVVGVFLIVALWLFIRWCLWRRKKPYTSGSTPVLV